jgi:hypothetical protein
VAVPRNLAFIGKTPLTAFFVWSSRSGFLPSLDDGGGFRWNEPLGGNRLPPEKNRKIRGRRKDVEVIQNVRGMATVICSVVDDMEQNISLPFWRIE